jgi:outer membrane biosynthesis protein TonB
MEAARRNPLANMSPALAGSLLLHVLIAAAFLISWPWGKQIPIGTVVPVTVVTQGPPDVRPAEQAPVEQTAQVEEPEPAPPEPVTPPPPPPPPAPAPKPTPAPPKPAPPKPTPKPAPAPAKPAPPEKTLDFDALQKSIARSRARNPAPPRPNPAPRGPTRPETAVEARPALGPAQGLSAAALGALANELQRRWNPNCEVEGGSDVNVRVAFRIGTGGRLLGQPVAQNINSASPVVRAAADRAVRAVRQAEPFESLPSDLFGQQIVVTFDAKQACSSR